MTLGQFFLAFFFCFLFFSFFVRVPLASSFPSLTGGSMTEQAHFHLAGEMVVAKVPRASLLPVLVPLGVEDRLVAVLERERRERHGKIGTSNVQKALRCVVVPSEVERKEVRVDKELHRLRRQASRFFQQLKHLLVNVGTQL